MGQRLHRLHPEHPHNCYGIQLDHYREKRYYLDRPYPANQAQFKA